jgi:hypothetical protein
VDDNPHDPNAVEVWLDGEISSRVGYVERQDAPNYRNLPQGVSAWRIRVTGRSDYAIYAMLEMLRTEDAALPDRGAPQQGRTPLGQGEDLFSQELRPESHNGRPVGPAVDSREQASAKPVSGDKGQEDDHGSARLVL